MDEGIVTMIVVALRSKLIHRLKWRHIAACGIGGINLLKRNTNLLRLICLEIIWQLLIRLHWRIQIIIKRLLVCRVNRRVLSC